MGIESDQLVYDYLSRVGDLAQRRQVPSGDRMRLVSSLRNEIDRQRAKFEPETAASVRRILDRLGSPEEVLEALAESRGGPLSAAPAGSAAPTDRVPAPAPESRSRTRSGPAAGPSVPVQRGPRLLRRNPRPGDVPPPRPATAASPPHLAGLDELGDSGGEPDWWRVTPAPFGPHTQVEGFAGGIEIPELLKRPADAEGATSDAGEAAGPAGPAAPAEPVGRVRTVVRALRERRRAVAGGAEPEAAAGPAPAGGAAAGDAAAPRPRPQAWLLLCAAVLVAGAVSGYWIVLLMGWLLAYASRRMSPAERKWVVLGLPGLVAGAAVVWVWGRATGRWGEPLGSGGVGEALSGLWGGVVRAAGVVSAGYLAWRSRRP
ncbi:hypothetical protein [Streptomyces sp. NRRL S-87]|uniref:hypothetical protein n=1 Tax=Streptomyces sp. NRRL S-87 TaxID=1463920 RepID=UPI0004C051A7|nr:hypothetical protein [Streptomyces sp. NRRL S-87]